MNDSYEPGVISDCCGAEVKWGDICVACGEHSTPIEDDEEEDMLDNI